MLANIRNALDSWLNEGETAVRFAITHIDEAHYHCEFGVLEGLDQSIARELPSIFEVVPRKFECTEDFNIVFIVPTGIGAEVGGHAGDATPVARVLAEVCDILITHPNVVNASDINEMPQNALYVEGSTIARLMMGTVGLHPVRSNRVMMIMDAHEIEMFANDTVNAVSAARATYGLNCPKIIQLDPPLRMAAEFMRSGRAAGKINGLERVLAVLDENRDNFDALAIASVIELDEETHQSYFQQGGEMSNPWGGVEAMLTHALSLLLDLPTAHSPMLENHNVANFDLGLVEPRLAAEAISLTFIQCMLKGLHRSPGIVTDSDAIRETGVLSAADISCLVIPDNCIGLPTLAALEQGIPVIAVRENKNMMKNDLLTLPWAPNQLHVVENTVRRTPKA
tara:strand:+ start:2571 stop:3758 length:1188 start_codon:yes stop_codon:yes gene_type:complete